MPQFTVVSRDPKGQRSTRVTEAETRQDLLRQFKDQGLTAIEISELLGPLPNAPRAKQNLLTIWASLRRVDLWELAVFWRELATMVAAGLPVAGALESIAEELEHVKLRTTLNDVVENMWKGLNFSQSIARHPRIFSPMVAALVGAAEESGSLPEISDHLATFLENRDRILHKVRAALTYPIFLCGFFGVVMAVATFFIIPKFRDIYEGFHAQLPWLTQTLFAANAFILARFPWIAAVAVAVVIAFLLWIRRPSGRAVMDHVAFRLPIFGKLMQRASVSRFCRTLAILLAGGIPINRALEMAQETAGNSVIARAIRNSREEILKGGKIAASFRQQAIFPPMVLRMVSAGEETGSLSKLLEKVADFYEARVDAALSTINALIEPVMIVVIGAFVLIFVLAIYLPIFSLGKAMQG